MRAAPDRREPPPPWEAAGDEDERWDHWEDYVQSGRQEAACHVILRQFCEGKEGVTSPSFQLQIPPLPKSYWAWQCAWGLLHFAPFAPQRR